MLSNRKEKKKRNEKYFSSAKFLVVPGHNILSFYDIRLKNPILGSTKFIISTSFCDGGHLGLTTISIVYL